MLLEWLIYGLLTWGLVALLNATAFKQQPASKAIAWTLTVVMFFVSLIAMTALQILRYKAISDDLGFTIHPNSPLDVVGAFSFSWLFYSLLRKPPKNAQMAPAPMPASAPMEAAQSSVEAPRLQPRSSEMTHAPLQAQCTELTEEFWAAALSEFEGPSRRPGLWARAFADAQGNEAVAKATYLRDRASELAHEHQLQLARQERQSTQLARETELEHLSAEQRAYELLPKGRCPNASCRSVMPLSEKLCTKCGANFDGSGWSLAPIADPELVAAVWDGNWTTASKLLREGLKPIGLDENGNTLLDLAKKRGDKQMIQLLESYN